MVADMDSQRVSDKFGEFTDQFISKHYWNSVLGGRFRKK